VNSGYNGLTRADLLSPGWWLWSVQAGAFFYLVTLAVALGAFASFRHFGREARDGGWALGRLLSLIVPAWAVWFAASGPISTSWALRIVAPVVLLGLAAPWVLATRETLDWLRRHRRAILTQEALLAGAFALAIGCRSFLPAITWDIADYAAEKFTDMAILTACRQSEHFPPEDAWLAGEPVNYYYFGHCWWALWTRALGIPANVGYNLALCFGQAMATLLTFALVRHLTGRTGLALLGAFLLCWGGNPKGVWVYWRSLELWLSPEGATWSGALLDAAKSYDFWEPSRAMGGNVILEFPAFSFWLGDLHAHTHGYLLTLGFLLWAATTAAPQTFRLGTPSRPAWLELAPGAFLLGAMSAANTWDAISCAFAAVCVGWAVYAASGEEKLWRGIATAIAVGGMTLLGSVLFFGPFWRNFAPPSQGGFPFQPLPDTLRTPPGDFALHWGFPLAMVALCALAWTGQALGRLDRWVGSRPDGAWRVFAGGIWLVAGGLWAGASRFTPATDIERPEVRMGWAMAGLLWALMLAPLFFAWRTPRGRFALGLLMAGLGLALLPEVVYLDDVFTDELEKINTSFKFGYPTWPMLGVAALCVASLTREELQGWRPFRRGGLLRFGPRLLEGLVLLIWLAGALVYPLAAAVKRTHSLAPLREAAGGQSLDGWAFVSAESSDQEADYRLLRLLADATPEGTRLRTLEAVDGTYTYASRFATNLGWAAVVGWLQHGSSWRGGNAWQMISGRADQVKATYNATSPDDARALIHTLGIQAVFWGALERSLYEPEARDTLQAALFDWVEISEESGRSTVWLRPDVAAKLGMDREKTL
jgi:YYY domain-containing protein